MKKVSVIVPIYNVEDYLERCLNSLVNQTLEDIEIICVNDGSPDNSQGIIDEFVRKYPEKVQGYIKKNGGLSDARNFGIQYASGEYIGFLDSDDYAELDCYQLMYDKAITTKSDLVVCGLNVVYEQTGEKVYIEAGPISDQGDNFNDNKRILIDTFPNAWNKLYHRDLILDHDVRYPLGLLYEDIGTTPLFYYYSNKIAAVNKPLINYIFDRAGNITQTYDNRLYHIFDVVSITNNFFKEKNIFENYYDELAYYNLMPIFEAVRKLPNYSDKQFKREFLDKTYSFLNGNFSDWQQNKYYHRLLQTCNLKQKLLWKLLEKKHTAKIYLKIKEK